VQPAFLPEEQPKKESALSLIENTYVLVEREIVTTFIRENQLVGVLQEAREPINRAFGNSTVKTLTIVEDDEGFRTLFCLVMVPRDLELARNALRLFDQSWWSHRARKFIGKLNLREQSKGMHLKISCPTTELPGKHHRMQRREN
jgi:hypothetical protein